MTFPARELLKNWDEQQSAYIAHREERYNAALDVLAMLYGEEFHVVDLACGPGSFSMRLLNRFPAIRVTAIDLDPLLLTLAKEALSEYSDRIQFFSGDIATADCFAAITDKPQAVVSSTAIHWLLPEQQVALYRNIFKDRPTPLPTTVEFQLAALRQAGFSETGTLWQFLDDYVIAGWK